MTHKRMSWANGRAKARPYESAPSKGRPGLLPRASLQSISSYRALAKQVIIFFVGLLLGLLIDDAEASVVQAAKQLLEHLVVR